MAHCYNCGCEMDSGDKTRLCEKCKKIMLPFVKFTDASTSSAVRQLIFNEKNLRKAGLTDSGMEYLLRICEIRDKKRLEERQNREIQRRVEEERNAEMQAEKAVLEAAPAYTEFELPMDEPLNFLRKPYGKYAAIAEVVTAVSAVVSAGCFIYSCAAGNVSLVSLAAFAGLSASTYTADIARRLCHDMNEVKKRLR